MTEFVLGSYRLEVDVEATGPGMAVTVTLPGAAAAPTAETMLPQLGSCRQKQQRFWNPWGLTSAGPEILASMVPPGRAVVYAHVAHCRPPAGSGGGRAARCPRRHRRVRHRYGTVPPELPGALLPVLAFHDPALGAGGTGR